jgi:large subunit ribosomal protein L22
MTDKTVRCMLKFQNISAQKMRPLLRSISNKSVDEVATALRFSSERNKSSRIAYKALTSVISNAENNSGLDIYDLIIKKAVADESYTLKRMRARAKGRGARIFKRRCHVTIEVAERGK